MRPFDVADFAEREAFPRPAAIGRLNTMLNGRHGEAPGVAAPARERSEVDARQSWRRFVQLLNHRGEAWGDE